VKAIFVIVATGFIAGHIVRQRTSCDHGVAVYHRGQAPAVLPERVQQIIDPHSTRLCPSEGFRQSYLILDQML
jgi:hypothetical protein